MKILAIALIGLFLVGCQTTVTRTIPIINFEEINIPSQLLDCDGKKISIPDPKKLTNKQITQYVIKLVEILDECQSDTTSIKKIIEEYNKEVQRINERSKNDRIQ